MAKQQPIELFMPPNILKAKMGGGIGGLDMAAVKRAEQAIETLKTEFTDWIAADVTKLSACRDAYAATPGKETCGDLYRASHDLRGQALTFEFPLVARVAAILCKLLDSEKVNPPLALIDAHVNAIRVIVKQNIKDKADKTAAVLIKELDVRVDEVLAKPA
ncbi:MAG: Hpt domain-containing protein [Proteobacteria bacterium]|nr:Hpt domain-containing protein [Pseudomonadota bacterium]